MIVPFALLPIWSQSHNWYSWGSLSSILGSSSLARTSAGIGVLLGGVTEILIPKNPIHHTWLRPWCYTCQFTINVRMQSQVGLLGVIQFPWSHCVTARLPYLNDQNSFSLKGRWLLFWLLVSWYKKIEMNGQGIVLIWGLMALLLGYLVEKFLL